MAKRHHPDLHPGPEAVIRMAEINRAYELLSDPARRLRWDATHPVRVSRPAPTPRPASTPRPAADPTAPPRDHGAAEPTLEAALAFVLTFGKFRGRTLGYVAAFEPGYIAWIVRTISNRPIVARHARVVLGHLERQGWRDTPRPPKSRPAEPGAGSGPPAGPAAARGGRPGTTARPTPSPRADPAPEPRDIWQRLDDHAGLVGLGMTVLGVMAWFAGIPPETVSSVVFLGALIGWPIWNVFTTRRHRETDDRRTGFHARRGAVGEVVFVVVLLAMGWGLLQGILEGPQPGDIVCDLFDPRTGDCVIEHGDDVTQGEAPREADPVLDRQQVAAVPYPVKGPRSRNVSGMANPPPRATRTKRSIEALGEAYRCSCCPTRGRIVV